MGINLPFKIGISPKLKIRGLIATENITKNKIIEVCPLILVESKYENFLEESNLKHYYFKYDKNYYVIALGYVSIINHSYSPNSDTVIDFKKQIFNLIALKDIKKGQELTIKYMNEDEANLYPELFDFDKGIKQHA